MADHVATQPSTLEQLSQKDYFAGWNGAHGREIISRAKQIILETIESLQRLEPDADYDDKEEIFVDAVLRFNDLNEDYDSFIETMERQSICESLLAVAEAVGLEPDEDLLEDRDW
jgi:hypothetical protein